MYLQARRSEEVVLGLFGLRQIDLSPDLLASVVRSLEVSRFVVEEPDSVLPIYRRN
jgi:hypothetical protein